MFFFWAFVSMLGYAVQDTLLVKYARQIDGLTVAIYRNTSFIITLLPLLFLTPLNHIQGVVPFLPRIMLSGFFGACAVWISFLSLSFLPVGIYSSFSKSITVIGLTLCSYFFLGETLDSKTITIIGFILISIIYLGKQKNQMSHLSQNTSLGILFTIISSCFAIATIFLMIKTSRELNPFVSGYFWESSIGIFALLIGVIRHFFTKHKLQKINCKTFFKIALAASPTLIGTGAFALAVTLGPIAIVTTIGATLILVTSFLAHFLYQEKFNHKQWLGLILVTIGIIALKLTI